jgi:putative hydrolase of the HAD superfamily
MKTPTLIFDFGGVLFHWNPLRLLARVLPHRADTPAKAEHWKGQFFQGYTGDWGAFDSGLIGVDELCQRIASRTGLSQEEVQAVVDAVPNELAPIADTVTLLRRLREAGYRLHYLSNMPAPYARHLLQTHSFLGLFDDGIFSCDVRLSKPAPAIFQAAFQRFDLQPAQAVFIDDHPPNISTAQALGLPALLFTDAPTLEAALSARGLRF